MENINEQNFRDIRNSRLTLGISPKYTSRARLEIEKNILGLKDPLIQTVRKKKKEEKLNLLEIISGKKDELEHLRPGSKLIFLNFI